MRAIDTRADKTLQTYDDTYGPLWVFSSLVDPVAVIRAQSFEDAWGIALDEFATTIPVDEVHEAYGFYLYESDGKFRVSDEITEKTEELIFDTKEKALTYLGKLRVDSDRELVEGYEYQANATNTGIVYTEYLSMKKWQPNSDIDMYLSVGCINVGCINVDYNTFEIELNVDDALAASQPDRDATEEVKRLCRAPYVREQLDHISDEGLRNMLSRYAAWNDKKLDDRGENEFHVVWIAAGDIRDEFEESLR